MPICEYGLTMTDFVITHQREAAHALAEVNELASI